MRSFEEHKFKANTLRIFGLGLISPLASLAHLVMTKLDFSDIFTLRGLIAIVFAYIGFSLIILATEILGDCDELSNRVD